MNLSALSLVTGAMHLAPALAKVFGANPTSTALVEKAAEVARQVTQTNSNEQALAKLTHEPVILADYQKALLQHEVELEELQFKDRESARLRDTEFIKAGTRNYRGDFLTAVSILAIFTIIGVVSLVPDLSEYAKGTLTTVLGMFIMLLKDVSGFEFGATRKS